MNLNHVDDANRWGEKGTVPFRSGRIFNAEGKWFFFVRGGGHKGPYDLREEAEEALSLFVNNGFLADHKSIVTAYFDDLWSCGDFKRSRFLLDQDMRFHALQLGDVRDRAWLFELVKLARISVPDLTVELNELIDDGDKIAATYTLVGTHQNSFMGIQASNKEFRTECAEIFEFAYDKIVSIRSFANYSQIVSEALRVTA